MKTRLIPGVMLLAALGLGVAACTSAAAATATTAAPAPGGPGLMAGPGAYRLSPMPAGTVSLTRDGQGQLRAHVRMFGLTPGSSHAVAVDGLGGAGRVAAQFPVLTADAAGQVDTTLTSAGRVTSLPPFSRFVIRLGSDGSALAAEPIAESRVLPEHPHGRTVAFRAVTAASDGTVTGQPRGAAMISYDAAAQTLTVTVSASGLNPGPHAAHIHLGSCASQGPVKYMLPDFIADGRGDIDHQTRMVTGVASIPGPGNWYLNLHMGGMNQILADGAPTLSFRPLLCTNVTSVAGTGTATTTSPAPTTTAPDGPGSTVSPMPSSEPSTAPVSYPTHF